MNTANVKDILKETYSEYSTYINSGRVLVNIMDGFKNAQRRILQGARETCKDKNVKCATLDGHVIGHYHPHGSCWGTMVNMTRDGYLTGKGNFGSTLGVTETPPAASRYPEIRLNKLSEKLFLNFLLNYVPVVESDLGYPEYEYLPSLIPGIFSGLTDESSINTSMGVHLKCVYPKYDTESIVDFIIKYLETGKWDSSIPVVRFHNIFVKNKASVTKSKFEIEFVPLYRKEKNDIHLLSITPNKDMVKLLDGIPYKDISTFNTDIVMNEKYFDIENFTNTVKFNSLAYLIENKNLKIYEYSLKTACHIIVIKIFSLMKLYFKDQIEKYTNKLEEYKKIKNIRKKIEKSGNVLYNSDFLTDEETKIVREHRIVTMLDIDDKIKDTEKILNEFIERSKDIKKEVLLMYKDVKSLF